MSEYEGLEEEYYQVLQAIQTDLYKSKTNKPSVEVLIQLNNIVQRINEKRRLEKDLKKRITEAKSPYPPGGPQRLRERESEVSRSEPSSGLQKPKRIRPYYLKVLNEVFSADCLNECIFQFIPLEELMEFRLVSKNFNVGVYLHLQDRIKEEEKAIENLIFSSDQFLKSLKNLCMSQFPRIEGTWVCLDKNEIKERLANTFTRNDLEKMKFLKNIPDEFDHCFAPFCVIFNLKPAVDALADGSIKKTWKKTFLNFTSNAHFTNYLVNYDLALIKEKQALEVLDNLNKIDFEDDQLSKTSSTLFLIVDWSRTVFNSYLCRNIFKIRDSSKLYSEEEKDLLEVVDRKVNLLRKFKILVGLQTEEKFLIDFSDYQIIPPLKRSLTETFDDKVLKTIIGFLEIDESIKLRTTSKKIKQVVEDHLRELTDLSIYFYETTKLKNIHLQKKLPILFELGLFSKCFVVLEHILRSKDYFFSKNEIDELKRMTKPTKLQESVCRAFCVLFRQDPVRKQKIADGYVELHYYPVVKNLFITKNYKIAIKNFNIYFLAPEEVIEAERILAQIEQKNIIKQGVFTSLFLLLRAIVTFHKIMNPLQLTPSDYIMNRFTPEEREALNDINLKYDDLRYFFQKSTALKLLDIINSLSRVLEVLNEGEVKLINTLQKDYYNEIHAIYFGTLQQNNEYTLPFFFHKIAWQLFDTIRQHERQDSLWAPNRENLLQAKEIMPGKKFSVDFRNLDLLIIKRILDFLQLEEIDAFARLNRDCNQIYKIYIIIRLPIETNRIKLIEQENFDIIQTIQQKREEFCNNYEIPMPEKERAIALLTDISSKDITELKSLKSKTELLDTCAIPFIILMEDLLRLKNVDLKSTKISNWQKLFKLIISIDFFKAISEFQVEILPYRKMRVLEKFFADNTINMDEVAKFSTALFKLMNWIQGLIEIHKFIRKFYVSVLDDEILDEDEKHFARYMDHLQLRSYLAIRAIEKFPETYHIKANALIENIPGEEEGEIEEYSQQQESEAVGISLDPIPESEIN